MASTIDMKFREVLQAPMMTALAADQDAGMIWFPDSTQVGRDAGNSRTTPVEPDARKPGLIGFFPEVFEIVEGRPCLTVGILFKKTPKFNVWVKAEQYDWGSWNVEVPHVSPAEIMVMSGWFGRFFQAQKESDMLRRTAEIAEEAVAAAKRA